MKLTLYYVVKEYEIGNKMIGNGADCEYVAGPVHSLERGRMIISELPASPNTTYAVVAQTIQTKIQK